MFEFPQTSPIRLLLLTGLLLATMVACAVGDLAGALEGGPLSKSPLGTPTATPFTPPKTEPSPTPLPPDYYINPDYHFAFEIPPNWRLRELESESDTGEGSVRSLVLNNDGYEIIFEYKSVFDGVRIGPSGLPAGELMVDPDALTVFGRPTSAYRLIFQDRLKLVFYDLRFKDLRGFVVLRPAAGSGADYEAIDLPSEIQADLVALLQSLTRTGEDNLPSSLALLAEFPVMLPMEQSYYSQVYDTAVANACGPAAATMVLDYYGLEDSLAAVIDELRAMPGPGAFDPNCYENTVCTSPAALAAVLAMYGLDARIHENWTLAEVFATVANGYPIIADILWEANSNSLGHFVVIYGVDAVDEVLYYHDPYRGSEMTASWDSFASLWEGRVDVGDPLSPDGHRFWGVEVRPPAAGAPAN